jgi:pectate lyase
MIYKAILPLALLLQLLHYPAYALPAFPGAEGMGASTVGGRGGTVIKVTNLNDSGPGSFRAAVTANGPRIVIFAVSGTINLAGDLTISNPYITIAGQTSPGGICVTGYNFIVAASNVVITHMRFRAGSHGLGQTNADAVHSVIVMGGNPSPDVTNVVFDHCSMSWGIDETVDVAYNSHNITFSWCIIGPGLFNAGHSEGSHSAGMVLWGKYARPNQTVSVHHCFFPDNHFRDPEIGTGVTADLRNNVAYNWRSALSPQFNHVTGQPHSYVNFIHNYSKGGPDGLCSEGNNSEMFFCDSDDPVDKCHAVAANAYQAIFYLGNLGCARTSQSDPEWQIVTGWSPMARLTTDWQSIIPFTTTDIPVIHTNMSASYAATIVANAGATVPLRDSVDSALAADFTNGTQSARKDNVSYPADFPSLTGGPAPTDSDNDGMADAWEIAQFGSLNQTAAGDFNGDGYTNIEKYLNFLGGYSASPGTLPPVAPSGLTVL